MAKKQTDSVYRVVDVVGVSDKSWEDAGRRAVETAAGSLRDLRVAEVTKMDMRVENGKVLAFRTRVALSFKYEVLTARQPRSAAGRLSPLAALAPSRRNGLLLSAAFLAAGFREYPHSDDKEDSGEEDEAVKVRLDRRAAPQHKPERHRDDQRGNGRFHIGRHGETPRRFNGRRPALPRPLPAPSACRANCA